MIFIVHGRYVSIFEMVANINNVLLEPFTLIKKLNTES